MLSLSAGFTIEKLDTYCTTVAPGVAGLALGSWGARLRSVMIVLFAAPTQLANAELAKRAAVDRLIRDRLDAADGGLVEGLIDDDSGHPCLHGRRRDQQGGSHRRADPRWVAQNIALHF